MILDKSLRLESLEFIFDASRTLCDDGKTAAAFDVLLSSTITIFTF
jgi:hypothetical protein